MCWKTLENLRYFLSQNNVNNIQDFKRGEVISRQPTLQS